MGDEYGRFKVNIIDLIYTTLERENNSPARERTAHYPSSASILLPNGKIVGKQLLDQYLEWKKVPPSNPITPQSYMKFKLGDASHLAISKILSSNGIKVLHEVGARYVHSKLQYPISYRVDSLIETPEGLAVLEVKTTQQNSIFGPWGVKENGPKLEHVLQVIFYLAMVPGVKYGILLYLDRGSGGMAQFKIYPHGGVSKPAPHTGEDRPISYTVDNTPSPITFEDAVDRWIKLEKAFKENIPPSPEYKIWLNDGEPMDVKTIKGKRYKSDWQAMYSPYRDLIYKDPKNERYTYNYEFKEKGLL